MITYYQRAKSMLDQQDYTWLVAIRAKKTYIHTFTFKFIISWITAAKHAERQLNTIDPNCNLRPFTISQTRPRISYKQVYIPPYTRIRNVFNRVTIRAEFEFTWPGKLKLSRPLAPRYNWFPIGEMHNPPTACVLQTWNHRTGARRRCWPGTRSLRTCSVRFQDDYRY